jgi:hypothetical protein
VAFLDHHRRIEDERFQQVGNRPECVLAQRADISGAYIRDFNAAVASTSTPIGLYDKMLALYPNRVNPGSLWAAANALKRP